MFSGKKENLKYISFLLFPFLLFFFKERDYIYTSGINPFSSEYGVLTQLGIDVYRWGIGLIGSVFILSIIQIIYKKLQNNKSFAGKLFQKLESIGQFSLQIYLMQILVLERIATEVYQMVVDKLGYNPLTFNIILFDLFTFLIALIFIIFLLLVSKGLKKISWLHKILFGR